MGATVDAALGVDRAEVGTTTLTLASPKRLTSGTSKRLLQSGVRMLQSESFEAALQPP
jgi:hypothetical protein